jgi:hypothetical protein
VARAEVYCCSTLLSLATAVVAGGLDRPTGGEDVRRVLLVSDYAAEAEVGQPLLRRAGTDRLTSLFDEVVDVNALIAPLHPGAWDPGPEAVGLLGELLRERWGLGAEVALYVEPYQVNFARWALQLFPEAPVTVLADGLMAYGPSRQRVPELVGRRLVELAHLDLVPGLVPVYLSEHRVPARPLAGPRVRSVLDRIVPAGTGPVPDAGVLVLGQYLSALGILTEAEEEKLYAEAVVQAARRHGCLVVGFKPHPAASPLTARGVQRAAAARGVEVELVDASGPAESLFGSGRYRFVHGCFSTGLFTAAELYGLTAVAFGTDLLLSRLTPYQNSNRIPVTLADLLLSEGDRHIPGPARPQEPLGSVGAVVRAVAYCMQPAIYPDLRADAAATWAEQPARRDRYVRRRRLTALGLPGARPARQTAPLGLRVRRRLRRLACQVRCVPPR